MTLRGRPTLRTLDRYLGIPVIALLGLRAKRAMPSEIRRIGVLRTAAIGEVLLISAILTDLRKAFPSADIAMITGEGNAEMGALVARGRCRHVQVHVSKPLRSARALQRERFDILIDTGPWPRFDAVLTAMSSARFTIGFNSRNQARHFAYDLAVPHSRDVHEIENFRSLIRPLGITALSPPGLQLNGAEAPAGLPAGPHIVFHPWSGGYRAHLREWPAERWAELAHGLQRFGATVLISGGPGDALKSEALADAVRRKGIACVSIAGMPIEPMIPVLKSSAVVVGVNTSVTHLASILEAPTVMLQGPTSPRRWGPLGSRSMSVCSVFPGCGFVHHGFEYKGQREDCMLGVHVEAVLDGVRSVMQAAPQSSIAS
jgi:ADP-heptose:LPS heptosyltransferase